MLRRAFSTEFICCGPMLSMKSRNRSLVTARIWSITAAVGRPWHNSGTRRGGLLVAELESGATTTVLRCRFTMFVVNTRQGRVLRISAPSAGSSLTHQISPRFGTGPGLAGFLTDCVELFFNGSNLRITVRNPARLNQESVPRRQFLAKRGGEILGTLPSRNTADKLLRQVLGKRKRHLSCCHTPILPYRT